MLAYMSPHLPKEHAAALRRVDLHLHGGFHGTQTTIEPYGVACLGVVDGDYEGIGRVMDRLDPDRGDVYAYESAWHTPSPDNDWFITRMHELIGQSLLLDVDPFDIRELARQARQGQVFSPPTYAQCLAIAKGVRLEYADATFDDQLAWLGLRQQYGIRHRAGLNESSGFREIKMVERLGAIAVTMPPGKIWRRPTLAMTVGDNHITYLKRHLRAHGVFATSHRYSPNLKKRQRDELGYIVDKQPGPYKERWIARAEQLLADRER
jgi:hypothetical protein